jgi:N-carbamoyl-L-amino-acid hydrolase
MISSEKPVEMNPAMGKLIEQSCFTVGASCQILNTGSGHDAMNMAKITPSGMVIVPSRNGISHNPDEYTEYDDIMIGIDVLTEALYQLAK